MTSDWDFQEDRIVATRLGEEYHLNASQLTGTGFPAAKPVFSALFRLDEFESGYALDYDVACERLIEAGLATDMTEADATLSYLDQTNRLSVTEAECILFYEDLPADVDRQAAYNTWGACIEAVIDRLERFHSVSESKETELREQRSTQDDSSVHDEVSMEQLQSLSMQVENVSDVLGSLKVQRDRLAQLYRGETTMYDEALMDMVDHISLIAAAIPTEIHIDEDPSVERLLAAAENLSAVNSAVAGVTTAEELAESKDTMELASELLDELE